MAELGVAHLGRSLTDNGTEYRGRASHPFEALCARVGTEHRYTKVRHAWTNGKAERFLPTVKDVLEELRQKIYRTIAELQAERDERIGWYNTRRPPVQVIREFLAQQEGSAAA
jgi:transposase InsO family protein